MLLDIQAKQALRVWIRVEQFSNSYGRDNPCSAEKRDAVNFPGCFATKNKKRIAALYSTVHTVDERGAVSSVLHYR